VVDLGELVLKPGLLVHHPHLVGGLRALSSDVDESQNALDVVELVSVLFLVLNAPVINNGLWG